MPLPTLPELSDLGARKEAASARFAKVIGIMANFANSSDAEKQEVGDTLNAAMQELIALDEKILGLRRVGRSPRQRADARAS